MKTKVTGYLTQKHGFYYVVLNLPTDEKGKRNRKTLSTGLSTDRNATKAKALLLTMIREANAGEEVRGVNERQPKSQNKTEDERWNSPWPGMLFSDYLEFWLQWKRKSWEEVTYSGYCQNVRSWIEPYFAKRKVRLNEITVLDIEMFYTHEINQRGVSGNTVLHYHANIATFCMRHSVIALILLSDKIGIYNMEITFYRLSPRTCCREACSKAFAA